MGLSIFFILDFHFPQLSLPSGKLGNVPRRERECVWKDKAVAPHTRNTRPPANFRSKASHHFTTALHQPHFVYCSGFFPVFVYSPKLLASGKGFFVVLLRHIDTEQHASGRKFSFSQHFRPSSREEPLLPFPLWWLAGSTPWIRCCAVIYATWTLFARKISGEIYCGSDKSCELG